MEAHKGIPTVMTLVFVDDLDTGMQEIEEASRVDDYVIFLSKENLNHIVNNIINNPYKSFRKIE